MRLPAIGRWAFSGVLGALLLGLSLVHWRVAFMELFYGDIPTGLLFLVVGSTLYVATLRVVYVYVLGLYGKPKDPEDVE